MRATKLLRVGVVFIATVVLMDLLGLMWRSLVSRPSVRVGGKGPGMRLWRHAMTVEPMAELTPLRNISFDKVS